MFDQSTLLEGKEFEDEMSIVQEEADKRFPLLVLVDLNGTLLHRVEKRGAGLNFSFKEGKHAYWLRPGHDDFILALTCHPRIKFGLYSSIMRKNVLPLLCRIFDKSNNEKLEDLARSAETAPLVFDHAHCASMFDHKYYKELAEHKWDTFRDLTRVF